MGQWLAKAEETALTERSVYRILNLRRRILLSTVATEPEGANSYFLRHDVAPASAHACRWSRSAEAPAAKVMRRAREDSNPRPAD